MDNGSGVDRAYHACLALAIALLFTHPARATVGTIHTNDHSQGTCFVVGSDGDRSVVLTNKHVVRGSTAFNVLFNGHSAPASGSVKYVSETFDVAVLLVDGQFPPLKLAAAVSKAGEPIMAQGYPMDSKTMHTSYGNNRGYFGRMLQGSAVVDHGVSGGPILNDKREVVGQIFGMETDGTNRVVGTNVEDLKIVLAAAGYI